MVGNVSGLESLEEFTFIKTTGQYFVENGIRKFNVEAWDRKIQETYVSGTLHRDGDQITLTSDDGSGKQYPLIDPPADVPLDTTVPETMLSVSGVLVDGKIFWTYIQFLESYTGGGGGGGGGLGFYKLNLSGPPVPFPSPTPRPDVNPRTTYVVQENDTIASIALNFGVSIEALAQANGITGDNVVFVGQTLVIPNQQLAPNPITGIYTVKEGDTLTSIAQNFGTTVDVLKQLNGLTDDQIYLDQPLYVPIPEPTEQRVKDLRGYLSISIHNRSHGSSTKEYNLEVIQENGSAIHTLEGPMLSDLDVYNQLPILITGTINTSGKLVVDSYKIPYPDLQFQILKGTQRTEQLDGQSVVVFTAEDGTSYVEFLVTNNIPNDRSLTGYEGDLIEQEVLIIPDEIFGGMPVAHIYRRSIVQEGAPAMEVQANRISVYNEPDDPLLSPDYVPPSLMIDQVELVYFVSNPYYQVSDPNYSLRSTYIQPVWHFHGRYEDGGEFDVLIQALKQEFLLPELVPNGGVG
jgi:LysM repeat protein